MTHRIAVLKPDYHYVDTEVPFDKSVAAIQTLLRQHKCEKIAIMEETFQGEYDPGNPAHDLCDDCLLKSPPDPNQKYSEKTLQTSMAGGGVIGQSWHPHVDDCVTGQVGGFPSAGYKREFKGWKPGCSCDAGSPLPCLVLDPFMGSGTVAVVARELNRSSVGCELNPEYVKIIKKRLQSDSCLDTGTVKYEFKKV